MPSVVYFMDLRASLKETNFQKFGKLLKALDLKSVILLVPKLLLGNVNARQALLGKYNKGRQHLIKARDKAELCTQQRSQAGAWERGEIRF